MTLVGAGGCGKTRLATEFACRQLADFRDGVWFAALDTVASGDAVPGAVADALGLSSADTAGQPALAATGVLDRLHRAGGPHGPGRARQLRARHRRRRPPGCRPARLGAAAAAAGDEPRGAAGPG